MLVFPWELSSPWQGTGKSKHDQLLKESTALGNLLLQAEKVAPQLRTHLITTAPKQVVQRGRA